MKFDNLPNQWSKCVLADLIVERDKINYGVVQPGGDLDEGVLLVRVGDFVSGDIVPSNLKRIAPEIDKKHKKSRLLGDEILLACVGSIGAVGLANPALAGANIARAVARIRCGDAVFRKYLYWYLRSPEPQRYFTKETRTVSQPTLNIREIEQTPILLPPLEEQRRIAAILDKADAVRRKRKEAIALTEELLRSAFLEMFGDPVENPKGWEIITLGNLLLGIESGWSPECDSREAQAEEWGILKLGSVTWGHFNASENKALLPSTTPRPELEVKPGDLLFSRKNTYEHVGASVFVHTTRAKLMLPDLIFRFRLTDVVDPVYVWQSLSQKTMRIKLSRLASGSAGSMPNISKARLRTLPLPIPPLEIQSKYREIVNQFWKKQGHQKASLLSTDDLFSSLLQRAFRGEL